MAASSADDPVQRGELAHAFLARHGLAGLAPAELDRALCHRSYAFENSLDHDNERLEFLGDAVIGSIASEFLYEAHGAAREGELSKLRARMVSRTLLGRRGLAMGLGPLILLGRGEDETGGRARESNIGSALEAVAGVVYLQLGYGAARAFVREHVLEPMRDLLDQPQAAADFKSPLQELTQRVLHAIPVYTRMGAEGPDHLKLFRVAVSVKGRVLAEAAGPRVKTAENEAARLALEQIQSGAIQLGRVVPS